MAENNKGVGLLIVAFVAILIGVIGVEIMAGQINDVTDKTIVTETLNITPAIVAYNYVNNSVHLSLSHSTTAGTFRTDYSTCTVSSLDRVTNKSGSALTTPGYYNFTAASGATEAYIVLSNDSASWISASGNTTDVRYSYCGDDYLGGWGGTVTDLVPGFFALAILVVSAVLILYVMKNNSIDIGV